MILKKLFILAGFCLLTAALFAQKKTNYDAKWKIVDSLYGKKGLTGSALAEVDRIYILARQEHNDAQGIKALLYRFLLNSQREQMEPVTIRELDSAIAEAGQPAKSILQSLLARTYQQYFINHEWQLYNRTSTVNFVKKDIATWGPDDFNEKISSLYLASLREDKLLEQTKLDSYEPIIVKGNVRYLRPTLFDLLAHQALDFFKRSDRNVNMPTDVFEIDDSAALGDATVFAHHKFITADTSSLHYKALLLFQRLIGQHLADSRPDALIDVDLQRLQWANANGVMDNKELLYSQALSRITDRYGDEPAAAEAWYQLAQRLAYPTAVVLSSPPADTLRYDNVKAKAICDRVLAQKDSSEGKYHCRQLREQLLEKFLTVQTEKVNLPGVPVRGLVNWRNFDHLYLRLINMDSYKTMLPGIVTGDDRFWKELLSRPVYRSFDLPLPATNDYRRHNTEIAIGSLPPGVYALMSCADPGWAWGKAAMAVEYFYVSGIAYINKGSDYFVVNRESGQPLSRAKVQLWNWEYYSRSEKNGLEKSTDNYETDQNGHFLLRGFQKNEIYKRRALEITTTSDRLFIRDAFVDNDFNYSPAETEDKDDYEVKNTRVFLFLDRQIYRPGQTVWFKGIAVTKDKATQKSKLLADRSEKVFLYNANGEAVDSLDMKTNDFGSYHGTFHLPTGQLNGSFRVSNEKGNSAYFSVEEYKRPTFYVDYEKQTGSYRAGDSIHITGNAKAFAGNTLDGASVKYRIVRRTRFPHPWYFWRGRQPGGAEQEIKHGVLKTDGKGAFRLAFLAKPDRSVDRSQDPRFEYVVTADVTDINGETRSGVTTIVAGYTAVNMSVSIAGGNHQAADSLKALTVKTTNLAGEPVASTVHLSVFTLQSPDRLIRARMWERPDRFILSEKQFLDSFPHDEYRDELLKESWARGPKVWEETGSSGAGARGGDVGGMSAGGGVFRIPAGRLKPGWYLIESTTTDPYGQEVKDLQYVELFDAGTGKPATPQYNWALDQQPTAEPGDKINVETGSSAGNVFVIRKTEHAGEANGDFITFTLNREKRTTGLAITEADRGGISLSDAFVKDNRFYTRQVIVNVPWTNKQLTINYKTYRDKTLPGSGEKWSVTIAGQHSDKVSAEVLAAMYDASLDEFAAHEWETPAVYPVLLQRSYWTGSSFTSGYSQMQPENVVQYGYYAKIYDMLFPGDQSDILYGNSMIGIRGAAAGRVLYNTQVIPAPSMRMEKESVVSGEMYVHADKLKSFDSDRPEVTNQQPMQVRKNFIETAFFFPDLRTDSAGNVSFSFTMPDALTRWKWMTLAHTKDLSFGYSEKRVLTQKQLMVQPNVPRFLREGDHMDLAVKVVNLTDSEMTGQMVLQLTDPTTGETADGWFTNRQPNQYFTVGAGQSAVVSFPLVVPFQYNRPLTYRVVAQSRSYSDGEEATLPVVSNRFLVTETLPLNLRGNDTKRFKFDKLLQSGSSETLNHHSLTVEFTSNPAWYAVQSLPYLTEYPYECAEQTFNRFYANALASRIASSSPRLQEVFARWRTQDTAALLSNLQKNQELKTVLLEETPWVLQGKTEGQQKKNIALLFDMSRMSKELEATLDRLIAIQSPGGGFAWFKGGYDDLYITQYILTGIGHLQKLQAIPAPMAAKVAELIKAALPYVDGQAKKSYELMREKSPGGTPATAKSTTGAGAGRNPNRTATSKISPWIGSLPVQYLYMRSFFSDYGIPGDVFPAVNYFRKRVQQSWVEQSRYMQGMIALALFRTGDVQTARDIIRSLRQNAIVDEEKGMYWKGMEGGYYWYEAPVENQSLLIEAFREISGDMAVDRDLKTWLLKQKQTHSWRTTKATADACYALLLGGQDWLSAEREVEIRLGEKVIEWGGAARATGADAGEAGTGYNKKVFDGPFVSPSMGNIMVTMKNADPTAGATGSAAGTGSPAWGAVYWQYFDILDRVTPPGSSKAPLQLVKKLFIERNTDRGRVLDPVGENGVLKPGDKVIVRIELRVDRSMEYVHMKDMRAACMEPVNVISKYKWQGGLGYYESTKDASTDFFFSTLSKGTYVFEYPLLVGQSGNFSNGITSIECMYAPEFAFHTEGIRVNVEGTP
ncbi:MAG TPA: alpha-2-macroglobulin family protein [Puia sp.]|nr:alpha-2-macroglobulin family protein [Puia sp.]